MAESRSSQFLYPLVLKRFSSARIFSPAEEYGSESGFTLVEVLVSILMIAAFLTTALQALIAATAIKVKAEEDSEAITWIQEDLERIRFEANLLPLDPALDPAQCATTYATRLREQVLQSSPGPIVSPSSTLSERRYILQRTLNSQQQALQITYQVFRDVNGNGSLDPEENDEPTDIVRSIYSEVIPDVTFSCG